MAFRVQGGISQVCTMQPIPVYTITLYLDKGSGVLKGIKGSFVRFKWYKLKEQASGSVPVCAVRPDTG